MEIHKTHHIYDIYVTDVIDAGQCIGIDQVRFPWPNPSNPFSSPVQDTDIERLIGSMGGIDPCRQRVTWDAITIGHQPS